MSVRMLRPLGAEAPEALALTETVALTVGAYMSILYVSLKLLAA
jgi:hypothetical protein